MDIIKFSEYLLENVKGIELPILDVVIDNDGIVHNGTDGTKLIKGRVKRVKGKIESIQGPNDEYYPAGIDKNGNLIAVEFKNGRAQTFIDKESKDNVELTDLEKETKDIPMSQELVNKYIGWYKDSKNKKKNDYYDLVPITPTGWVNVKVDMEIVKRVRRYARGIGTHRGHNSFLGKLKQFQTISELAPKVIKEGDKKGMEEKRGAKKKRRTIQSEMSVIIMLHYINEIKDFFTPSSSGFLFESFLAGLIPNARVKEDNTAADLVAGNDTYQIKLISSETTYVNLVKEKKYGPPIAGSKKKVLISEKYLDYYVICLKYSDKIDICILKGTDLAKQAPNNPNSIITPGKKSNKITASSDFDVDEEGKIIGKVDIEKRDPDPKLKVSKILKTSEGNNVINVNGLIVNKYSIGLTKIDAKIEAIGRELKSSLDSLYEEISKFQYNVETLITGTKADGTIVSEQSEFERYYEDGVKNISKIGIELKNLKDSIEKSDADGDDDPNQLSFKF